MKVPEFFDRDLSWLGFNDLILQEAGKESVPLLERIRFLSIFSSNLDEFYRVRMPVLMALHHLAKKQSDDINLSEHENISLQKARQAIAQQLENFGSILKGQLIPLLKKEKIHLLYDEPIPARVLDEVNDYFHSQVMALLKPVDLSDGKTSFFPENNKLYFLVQVEEYGIEKNKIINIPSDELSRFYPVSINEDQYLVFLDDILRYNLDKVFIGANIKNCFSFKITRDAEIDLKDDYSGDLSEQIEKQLLKRDAGLATRFLHQPGMPLRALYIMTGRLNLSTDSITEGGKYHNLKDLGQIPVYNKKFEYDKWPALTSPEITYSESLFEQIKKKDLLVNAPYQSYDTILRFFNEAAIDDTVEEIYVTLYRVASNSRIVNSLISAAKNGKKVLVMIELKARFDEANNIKWAKKMKNAGVQIVYSATALKVHAKTALVKRRIDDRMVYIGLLSTGNFNETTAAFYTDHIFATSNRDLLREVELLFIFLAKRKKLNNDEIIRFDHLLVAQFNLQQRFLEMIDREITQAKQGLPASIIIKLNNLEERVLITKLYEASQAGVKISLIVRSICCLVPGVAGMSENITVMRIVDRYLEHGRIFLFHNQGKQDLYLGSADWMNRNIYHRIEVCFPIRDESMKTEVIGILNLQLADNVQAVRINENLENIKVENDKMPDRSQQQIYQLLKNKTEEIM